MQNRNNKLNKAFTLVETLVAVSIFTTSILVLMSVLTQGITNTEYAKEKMTATYLAQESIEDMRNMRDTYVLYLNGSSSGWTLFNSYLTSSIPMCNTANGCYFNDQYLNYANPLYPITTYSHILSACDTNCASYPLLYDSTKGQYSYSYGTNSGFTRQIKITQINANETKVSSTVFWKQNSGSYSVTFSENLFNWVE
jgi:type II secretory pathway pseudopilin PulG